MSTKYIDPKDVPTEAIINRLEELSHACVSKMEGDSSKFDREFTFRIPAELDRDADLVLSIAANRLREFVSEIKVGEL